MPPSRKTKSASVTAAAFPAEVLEQAFPKLHLPLQPPYPPAEAKSVKDLPHESGWLYEPKWDGFRCLAFRNGNEIVLQSKAGQPLGRYFPEIIAALHALSARKFVLDGELVIRSGTGLDFDALLQRIHPAASRIQRLSHETAATYMLFDLLVDATGKALTALPLSTRRKALEKFAADNLKAHTSTNALRGRSKTPSPAITKDRIILSPASPDFATAKKWMRDGAASGWDGVVAKLLDADYKSGERTGMVKIKRIRTADCVVGGFRWAHKGGEVGSLLLGLYNHRGQLDHIGFSSSFTRADRKKLKAILKPLIIKDAVKDATLGGFTGKAPGGPSRWTRDDRDTEWVPLKPKLVGEFQYDHFSGNRFRHGTKFLRWRPEKKPEQCRMEQVTQRSGKT
ncbi:MAG TPA: ATP-dependent DNA ligase [Candidatus Angelobacter sp.]|jgi:ATP-dependent DNA ligase|nr:ATP-dependent DNA ligase [Candidatus Angelobacter sp.]